ncbi:MAG: hypothetical protein QMD92_00430 [bacterium]|nr:hypothetical protein [bacterium]
MSKLFLESLDKNKLEVFYKLKDFKNIGVLGGGTALALQIGHRVSCDFDIFTFNKLDRHLWTKVRNTLGKNCSRYLDTEDQLNITTSTSVYVTFFRDDYKSLFKSIKTDSIDLMDIKDIVTNKAFIIGRRPKWRDYVDIYFIIKDRYLTLDEIMSLSKQKFEQGFSEKLFLEQLTYWTDIEDYDIEFLKDKIEPETIKELLFSEATKFTSKLFN